MRKLILFSGLFLFSVSVFAQDETDNKKTIFFRLGTGYGIHFKKNPSTACLRWTKALPLFA